MILIGRTQKKSMVIMINIYDHRLLEKSMRSIKNVNCHNTDEIHTDAAVNAFHLTLFHVST